LKPFSLKIYISKNDSFPERFLFKNDFLKWFEDILFCFLGGDLGFEKHTKNKKNNCHFIR
jgi:hypothetical protein